MNRSDIDSISLDEKIALIRKKNELIIKRKELIEKEIELAKRHNAMVDLSSPKSIEEDEKPTLYSDTIPKVHREETRSTVSKRISHRPKNNVREDVAWRAERNEIDRERIRRQRANSGWKREWDADKNVSDEKFLTDNVIDEDIHAREMPRKCPSHHQNTSVQGSEIPVVPHQNIGRGRGCSMVREQVPKGRTNYNQNSNISQSLQRTVKAETRNLKSGSHEKVSLKKKVSWGSESDLTESPRISLKDDHLKNIKVQVNNVDTSFIKRSIKITDERGPLVKSKNSSKFDEITSFNIKDCVSKALSNQFQVTQEAFKNTASLPKPKDIPAATVESKSIIKNCDKITKSVPSLTLNIPLADLSKDEKNSDEDDEWEDVSGEDWESVSEHED